MYEIEKISYTNKNASATTARLKNQTLFANAALLQQSIDNGLINTTNTVAWTCGNSGNGSSATPIEAIDQGAVDTTLALYNTLVGSVRRLPKIPPAVLPNSTLYPRGCNVLQYDNTGAVRWTVNVSGTNVSGHNLSTDGTNVYVVGDFSGSILIINSDKTQLTTPVPIPTSADGCFIVKYNVKGIGQWVAYLTSQTFLQLLTNVTDSINSYQAGNCFINTNVYNASGTLYRTLKPTINLYIPYAITNDGTYIYVIDTNSIVYQFKITGELRNTKLLRGYGLSSTIPSVTWLNGYLYIVDNGKTIWQLNTTFADPPVQFITDTSYPLITGSISITSNLANVLYLINSINTTKITKVIVNNTNTPPTLTSVTNFTIVPPVGIYNYGIVTPLCVSYTFNSLLSASLIITDYNTNNFYSDVYGVVWSVGPVNTNTYNATVVATTSNSPTTTTNINVPKSVQSVYAVYNTNRTSLLVYLTLYGSNNFIKFNYNGSAISNVRQTTLSGASVLSNITDVNSTLYVLNSASTGGVYSINSTTLSSKQIYPLAANYNSGFIIKYSQSGAVSWVSQVRASNTYCIVKAITIGSTGIYITGTFGVTSNLIFYNLTGDSSGISLAGTAGIGGSTAFVAKYSTAGNALWATKIGNTNITTGTSISVDGLGYVYVAGTYNGTKNSGSLKFYTANPQYPPIVGPPPPPIQLTGYNSASAVYLTKYTPTGLAVWATNSIAATSNTVNAITANNEAVYLVGAATGNITCNNTDTTSFGPINTSVIGNGVIIKYSSTGIAQWVTLLFGGIPYYISLFGNDLYISGQMINPVFVYNVPYTNDGDVIPPPSGQPINSGVSIPIIGNKNDFLITYTTTGIVKWGQNTSSPYQTSEFTGGLTYGKNVEYVSVSILPTINVV